MSREDKRLFLVLHIIAVILGTFIGWQLGGVVVDRITAR